MAKTTETSRLITIGGADVAVTVFHEERGKRRGRVFDPAPQPVTEWPLTAEAIAGLVQGQYAAFRCRPTRADVCWAIAKASDLWAGEDGLWFFRAVPTPSEAQDLRASERAEMDDGLC